MNATIFLLSTVGFIVVAVMTVTGPLLPLVAEEFSTSVGDAGIIVTAFAVPYGACQILFGPIGDRLGKLRVIASALAISSLFVLGCALVQTLPWLAVLRFASGFAMAATIPLAMAWIADEVPYANRQPVIGRYVNGLILGQMAGGVLGGIAAQYFEWRHVFFLLGGLALLFAAGLGVNARSYPVHHTQAQQRLATVLKIYGGLFRERYSRDVIIAGTLEGFLVFGVLAYFGAYLRHVHALDYGVIGVVLCTWGVGGLVYAAAVYRLVRVLGERRMIGGGTVLLGVCYLALTVVSHWWLCVPVFAFARFGFYLFHNTMQTRATELSSEARGTAVALWVFMLFVGQGLGVVFFGEVIDRFGYASAFFSAGCGIAILGLWFQSRLGWHARAHGGLDQATSS